MMGSFGNCNFDELKKLQERINKLEQSQIDKFCEACAKEVAARLLSKAIKRTPVGQYAADSGKKGGTLRRNWSKANKNIEVKHVGKNYEIEIINPTEYADYVEFGHRTANHKGWVSGKLMLTISEMEIERQAPQIIEKKLMKMLGECFDDK